MGKRILITGGAGFIGSALGDHLISLGHEVAVLDDLSFGRRDLARVPDARFFHADIRDRVSVVSTMESFQPHWVLHLAAVHFIPYCNAHPVQATDINVMGSMCVLDACADSPGLEQVFVASTAAVYPIADGPLSEDHELGPMDIYGITKLAGERLAHEYHLRTGVPTIVGRFFNAFGPNETNPHLIPEIQRQILAGQRTLKLGNLDPKRDFIHTEDMARAMAALLGAGVPGFEVYNIGRGMEYSVREIVEAFERMLGETLTIEVDPARVRKVERMHLLANVNKLQRVTGWEPTWDIDEGVATLLKEDIVPWS